MAKFVYAKGLRVVLQFPEAASQSFKAGQPVYLSGGKLTVCASDATTILGVADADASGTTDTSLPVVLATPMTVFSGASTNAGADVTTAVTYVPKHYALYVGTGTAYVDLGDTTNKAVKVVGLKDAAGTTNGKVYFKFIDAVSEFEDVE